jgi:Fur family peroxide stress response transcriptional regulator
VHVPPRTARPRRRNRSIQRERLLEWLRGTDSHPTAAEIHAALLPQAPRLSIATVYRNLEVLVADGQVDAVAGAGPALRYDANPEPHHHFVCERCGRIRDLYGPRPRNLTRRLAREQGLRAHRVRLDFYGRCPACLQVPEASSPAGGPDPVNQPGE